MTNEEFANSPAMSGILTQDEIFDVMNIRYRYNWPLSSQLSSSRQQRALYFFRRYTIGIIFNSVKTSNVILIVIYSLEATPVPPCRIYWYRRDLWARNQQLFNVNEPPKPPA